MGVESSLQWYLEERPKNAPDVFMQLVDMFLPNVRVPVFHVPRPQKIHLEVAAGNFGDGPRSVAETPDVFIQDCPRSDLATITRTSWSVACLLEMNARSRRICLASESLPDDLRQRTYLGGPRIAIEPTHLYHCGGEHDGEFIARAELVVGFSGRGTPSDPAKWEAAIMALPEFQELDRDIRGILGPECKRVFIYYV